MRPEDSVSFCIFRAPVYVDYPVPGQEHHKPHECKYSVENRRASLKSGEDGHSYHLTVSSRRSHVSCRFAYRREESFISSVASSFVISPLKYAAGSFIAYRLHGSTIGRKAGVEKPFLPHRKARRLPFLSTRSFILSYSIPRSAKLRAIFTASYFFGRFPVFSSCSVIVSPVRV